MRMWLQVQMYYERSWRRLCDELYTVSNSTRRDTLSNGLLDWSREGKKDDEASADDGLDALKLQETDAAKQNIENGQAAPSANALAAREQLEGRPRGVYGCPVTQINPFDPTNNTEFITQIGARNCISPRNGKSLPDELGYPAIIIATSSRSGDADIVANRAASKAYTEDPPDDDFYEDAVLLSPLTIEVCFEAFRDAAFYNLRPSTANMRVLIIFYDFGCHLPFNITPTPGVEPRNPFAQRRLPPPGSGEPSTGIPLRSADYEFDFGEFEYLFDDQTD